MARFTNGWVKLHRDASEKDLAQNIYLWALWWWLVANANWKDSQLIHNGKQRILPPGSVVMGIKQLSAQWKCNHMTLWKWLNYLRDTERVVYETHTRGTIVTICNWELYQGRNDEGYKPNINQIDAKYTPDINEVDAKYKPNINQVDLIEEGKKVKREESKKVRKKESKSPGIRLEYPTEFDRIWNLYGRKGDKKASYQEYKSLSLSEEDLNVLALAIKNYHATQPESRYRKDLERFLKTDWREWINPPNETKGNHPSTQKRVDAFTEWAADEEKRQQMEMGEL